MCKTMVLLSIEKKLDLIVSLLQALVKQETTMAVDMKALQAAVEAETTVENSTISLLNHISDELKNISTTADAATQAQIDKLTTQINDNSATLAAAVVANTPAIPVPVPDPAPVVDPNPGP